jgi:hypothetical protein
MTVDVDIYDENSEKVNFILYPAVDLQVEIKGLPTPQRPLAGPPLTPEQSVIKVKTQRMKEKDRKLGVLNKPPDTLVCASDSVHAIISSEGDC